MKVKEFAETQGITTQAVYQRLKNRAKKTGKQLSDYVSTDTSEITEEGYKILQSLYKQPVKQKSQKTTVDTVRISELTTELEKLKEIIKGLQGRIEEKDKIISTLEESVAHERQMNRLLVEAYPKQKTGIFGRLFGKKENKQ